VLDVSIGIFHSENHYGIKLILFLDNIYQKTTINHLEIEVPNEGHIITEIKN